MINCLNVPSKKSNLKALLFLEAIMVLESRFFNGGGKDVSTVLSHAASHYRMGRRAGKNNFRWQLRYFDKAQYESRSFKVSYVALSA
jgi:hypothetical protein